MVDKAAQSRMQALEARIARVKARHEPSPPARGMAGHGELAWRMVIELVAGIMIGFGIGYGLDVALGTMPLFLIAFTLLGLAAGIRVMLRSARELQSGGRVDRPDNGGA